MHYNEYLQTFINDSDIAPLMEKISLFIFRKDGILLYDHLCSSHKLNSFNTSSVGALMSGVWQASQTLFELFPSDGANVGEFRLSYDTSATGAYILPMETVALGDIYLGAIFHDEINPGQVKAKLRKFSQYLISNLKTKIPSVEESKSEESELLFQDISDEEIDRLFDEAKV